MNILIVDDIATNRKLLRVCSVTFIVSDDHPGMAAARKAVFGAVPWQRCQFHL